MSDLITLDIEEVDSDGAIREAEEAVVGDTRAGFFRKAAIGGGAAIGSGVLLGGLPELASARKSAKQDVKILNYALTLEFLESEFYKLALAKSGLLPAGSAARSVTKIVSDHENTHVRTLRKALGSKAKKKPSFDFGNSFDSLANYLKTAVSLEDTGVKAYSGQATNIKSAKVVHTAVSILTVEARHASRFRTLRGNNFAPRAFDRRAGMSSVLKKAKPFIKKK